VAGLIAELSPNRKNARCPACHRLLAVRSRRPDGSHGIYLDGDWLATRMAIGGLKGLGNAPRLAVRPWHVLTRNWRRVETERPKRHGGPGDRFPAPDGVHVVCGCGEILQLEFQTLDVTPEAVDSERPT
jgi:hypothetical protein